jgi:hypothetical protein
MTIDYFRVEVQQIKSNNDRARLNELAHQHYPDVFLRIHETLGPSQGQGGTPIDFEIEGSSKGIFALKKLIKRFDPWIIIEGMSRLDVTDFPTKLFENVHDGGVGKYWTSVKSRISELEYSWKIDRAEYFRVNIQQFEDEYEDIDYLSRIHRNFSNSFISVYEKYGPNDVEGGTPKRFAISNDESGLYVLKKILERYDPWVVVAAVRRYDRADMPKELFKTVEEGGIGKYWSEKAADRIESLDWP